jgi:hypothetical protein
MKVNKIGTGPILILFHNSDLKDTKYSKVILYLKLSLVQSITMKRSPQFLGTEASSLRSAAKRGWAPPPKECILIITQTLLTGFENPGESGLLKILASDSSFSHLCV